MNIQHEFFYQKVVEEKSLSDAYRIAYNTTKMKDTTVNNNAWILSNKSEITARFEDLRKRAIAKHDITVEDVIRDNEDCLSKHPGPNG
ncbi:MAG: hypothetical protein HN641_12580 [Candidatus Marinimicrobia bacterium]|nr:hypothetical protein [Candidatus Neomarinimicrobiota bacterium]MBT7884660.1 hypothetical protein [Candidatus Neomarinimicrobiota bacterium]